MASPSFSSKWLLIFTFIIDSLWRVFLQIPKISQDIMNIFNIQNDPSSANVTSTNVSKNTPSFTETCRIISQRSHREYYIKFNRSGVNFEHFNFLSIFQLETKNMFIETSFEIRRMQTIFIETSFEI